VLTLRVAALTTIRPLAQAEASSKERRFSVRDWLSELGVGHQWAYLPDVAETIAQLLDRSSSLESFEVFHMKGHWNADGTQMIDAIRRAARNPRIKVRPMPWALIRPLAPFVPLFRELTELRYLWAMPVQMGNERLRAALGAEPHTPQDLAVRNT
jgi:nucleoside-diphosphate-sugar epimerase